MNTDAVPAQQEGAHSDTFSEQHFPTAAEAETFYQQACGRLLNINSWKEISEGISAAFRLTDKEGNLKEGEPQPGDHFCISIPGPGNKAGDGFDWVKIEMVEREGQPGESEACTLMRVRPCASPIMPEGTAHFFDDAATSTFMVRRKGTSVIAEVHGRNEKPNTKTAGVKDKIRNSVVSTGAAAGMSAIQWKNLTKGLVALEK